MPDGDSTATQRTRHGRGGRPEADLALLGLAAVMSVATYVGAALSLIGAVPRRLRCGAPCCPSSPPLT